MDQASANWIALTVAQAECNVADRMSRMSPSERVIELQARRARLQAALERFSADQTAEAEAEEEVCDFNGCEVAELFEASHELGADYAGCKACRACINETLEQRESSGECRDYDEEMGGVR